MRRWSSSPIVDDPEGRRRGRLCDGRQLASILSIGRNACIESDPVRFPECSLASTEDTVVRGRQGEEKKGEKKRKGEEEEEEEAGKGKRASCVCTRESGSTPPREGGGGEDGRERIRGGWRGGREERVRERRGEREEG